MPELPGDPFASLHRGAPAVDPDPAFAAVLRARLERAVALPPGVTVSDLTIHDRPTGSARVPDDPSTSGGGVRHGDIVYVSLWVPDLERATAFFGHVLGWRLQPGGGGGARQLAGGTVSHGIFGGQPRSTLFLCYGVDDLDVAIAAVTAAGGQAGRPQDEPYGRTAECTDDQGVRFALTELGATATSGARAAANGSAPGDVSYITAEVVDSERTRAFQASVLGWTFTPGRIDDGWQVDDVVPMTGLSGGHEQATVVPMYRVDDIADAVERVRAAGGTATDPEVQPYGLSSTCTDDQGTHFYLGQH